MATVKRMQVAHYCSCEVCRGPGFTKTTTGTEPRSGTVLAHSDYPLGSKLTIKEYYDDYGPKEFTVEDRPVAGVTIPKERLYVWVQNHKEVIARGLLLAEVTFL